MAKEDLKLENKKIMIDTASLYVLEKGADVQALDLATIGDKCLGITRGGVEFTAKPNIREIEFDGKRERKIMGMDRVLGWEVSLETETLELLETNFTLSLLEKVTGTKYDEYVIREGTIKATDYNDIMAVGTMTDGKAVIIVIRNAFNAEGLSFKTEDSNEASVKMVFEGHYGVEDGTFKTSKAPFSIFYPKIV